MIIKGSHPLLTNIPEVNQICIPLKYLGITYFHAVRKFKNGSLYCLSSGNVAWHKYVFKTEQPASTNLHSLPSGNYLWSEIYPEQMNATAHNEFNIAHTFSILKNYGEYYDIYAFATTPKNHRFISFCRNNIDVLENFILYFNEKSIDLAQIAKKSPIILPTSMLEEDYLEPIKSALNEEHLRKSHESLKLKRFTVY